MADIRSLGQSDLDTIIKIAAELRTNRRYEDMEALLRVAVALAPTSAATYHNLGGAYKILGRLEEAEICARQALTLEPSLAVVRHALGIVLLSQGRYQEGFEYYEARHEIPSLGNPKPNLNFPEWKGEPIEGKSLVILPEQGFGDSIQFVRFAQALEAKGARVAVVAKPELETLFTQSLKCNVLGAQHDLSVLTPDYWALSSSLAWRLGLELSDIQGGPYLPATPRAAMVDTPRRIGVVTRGAPIHANDANRSLAPDMQDLVMSLPGDLVSLHSDDTKAKSFAETAAMIDGLDLVISVDSAVAHLAAAMGKPTWVMIPAANTDWRWGRFGARTPWYDAMRLFRQPTLGDWRTPISDMRAQLERGEI